MKSLSAVVIAYNEEEKISRALGSLKPVSDEIVVVDSYSTDRTMERCRDYTDRIYRRAWEGYRSQKQFATEQARHDWVLSLDADEELSPELQKEILTWKESLPVASAGYLLPRKTYFLGRWIRHTTWYPDWQLRLFRKSKGRWEGGRVHESFKVEGPAGRFRSPLLHYSYSSVSEYLEQLESFSALAAADYFDRGVRAGPAQLLFLPPVVFVKNYLLRLGFLDGVPGLIVSVLSAQSTFFKYLKLWELQQVKSVSRRSSDPHHD